MKITNKLISITVLASAIVACGHKKIVTDDTASIGKSGVMTVSSAWIKVKGKKFDQQVVMQNSSAGSEIVWLKDVHCSRGHVTGDVSMVNARHGDMPIWLRPRSTQTIVFTCDLNAAEVRGPFKISVSRVYENPSDDGRTTGKVIAKDLEIEQVDKQ
jgi:hypothetical protein